jgi:hypothetical protein
MLIYRPVEAVSLVRLSEEQALGDPQCRGQECQRRMAGKERISPLALFSDDLRQAQQLGTDVQLFVFRSIWIDFETYPAILQLEIYDTTFGSKSGRFANG